MNTSMDTFLRGHVLALTAIDGATSARLSDNLRSAVLERVNRSGGCAVSFHPNLLASATSRSYEPHPVAVAHGNQNGRSEGQLLSIQDQGRI